MRTIMQALLIVCVLAGTVAADEKVAFLDGVVSVTVPDGWKTETDEQQLAMSVIHESSPATRVIFSTPSLNTERDPSVSYERNLHLMYMFFGSDFNITNEMPETSYAGKTGMQMDYLAERDGRRFRGRILSYVAGDATQLCIAISTEEDFAAHEKAMTAIIQSYAVDANALQTNRQAIQTLSDRADDLYADLVEELDASQEEQPAAAQ